MIGKELFLQTEYWNILMPVDIYRLAKHGEGVLRAWKMIGVLFVYLMGVEKFSRVKNLAKCLTSGQPRISIVDAV